MAEPLEFQGRVYRRPRQARGCLRNLQTLAASHRIASPAILVVGAVLGTAAERPWVAELNEISLLDTRAAVAAPW